MNSSILSGFPITRNSVRSCGIALLACATLIVGCAPTPLFVSSDYEHKQITSIAIMPVIDRRNADADTIRSREDLLRIEVLLSQEMADKNYTVISAASVNRITDGHSIDSLSAKDLCSMLKVDGILSSELFDYSDVFFVDHSIKMNFKMVDAQGESLWMDILDDRDRPFLSAIGASIGWGIGISIDKNIATNDKLPTILAGVAAAELVYVLVDVVRNEASESITRAFRSLPDRKITGLGTIR